MSAVRHLISLNDLDNEDFIELVERGILFASAGATGSELQGRIVGTLFTISSTRTRTSFAAAAMRLGAAMIPFGPSDLQLSTGETLEDTGRILSTMIDCLVIRLQGGNQTLSRLATQRRMACVNAMSFDEHPTQAVADLITLRRRFGSVDGLRMLYLGEGNSIAAALALALAKYRNAELFLRTPPAYAVADWVAGNVARSSLQIDQAFSLDGLPDEVDVVYTTRWRTTGTTKRSIDWLPSFEPFKVTVELMSRYPNAVFMHDLPAHRGEEVDPEVLDGPQSIAFGQAENKLFAAMSALTWCLG